MQEQADSSHADSKNETWRTCRCLGCRIRRLNAGLAAAVDEPEPAPESSRADRPEFAVLAMQVNPLVEIANELKPGRRIIIEAIEETEL